MKKRRGCLAVALAGFAACLVAVAGLPLLAFGGGMAPSGQLCGLGQLAVPSDGAPGILGPSTLTSTELTTWWEATGRSHPPRLLESVADVIDAYIREGTSEGVRGDIAFAQAIHETGHFGSSDTARNNFAGIAHPEGAGQGTTFPDVRTGVRAHIQLLKKFADGNDTQLAHPDVAPDAGAAAQTWGQLAGTWASAPDYWTAISSLYDTMLTHAGRDVITAAPADPDACVPPTPQPGSDPPEGSLVDVRGIVVAARIAGQLDGLLAAAEADGITLGGWGYRSTQRQIELRQINGCPDIYESPASTCRVPTARPGNSKHEVGLAIDFTCNGRSITSRTDDHHGARCYRWLAAHAADYGLYELSSGTEPWHWSVDGS